MDFFEITHSSVTGKERCGILHLAHGDVETPVFMPVGTNATVKAVSKDDLEEIGFDLILANTYHLFLRPGPDLIQEAGGLHGFLDGKKIFLRILEVFRFFHFQKSGKSRWKG